MFPYIGNNHPNWLSYFSEGWLNHQPDMYLCPSWHEGKNYILILRKQEKSSPGLPLYTILRNGITERHFAQDFGILLGIRTQPQPRIFESHRCIHPKGVNGAVEYEGNRLFMKLVYKPKNSNKKPMRLFNIQLIVIQSSHSPIKTPTWSMKNLQSKSHSTVIIPWYSHINHDIPGIPTLLYSLPWYFPHEPTFFFEISSRPFFRPGNRSPLRRTWPAPLRRVAVVSEGNWWWNGETWSYSKDDAKP